MEDLTTGSLSKHLLKTTGFMLVTMAVQTLYFLVDLYWVGRLGTDAVAAVAIAGNWTYVVLALTQMLGVGTTAVVSHAIGRKDRAQAVLLFNQSQVLAIITGVVFLAVGLALALPYGRSMAADAATASMATGYLMWFVPAMALQFTMVAMGSALRGVGNFKPGMIVSTASVALNMLLAPVLIFGWGTGHAFGVAGAAMSSLVSVAVAVVWLATYFGRWEKTLAFHTAMWRPRFDLWRRILGIGLPAGFEFAIMAVYLVLVYSVIRPFGAEAQAAFGIGMRIVQAGFMAVVALGFSVAPVAGQNFGARIPERVKATFADAARMAVGYQVLFGAVLYLLAPYFVAVFSDAPATVAIGVGYLRIAVLSFLASGLIFVTSSMFQAMGNTMPALFSSSSRIVLFAIPLIFMARQPGFRLEWIWYLAVTTTWMQLGISLLLLRSEFRRRLAFGQETPFGPERSSLPGAASQAAAAAVTIAD